ncbi:MAG: alanine--tRNA ligase-related protein [archaeon]
MGKWTRKKLIKEYLEFFKSKNHKEIPNSSLIPKDDPTTLFIGSGVETIIPNVLGTPHPLGKRLTNVQKSIRTGDIDEVGDTSHHTFFEMLGNWSLGDYWKEEAIKMTFEFVTKILKVPKERLAATCFAGDKDAPKDTESEAVYLELKFPKERIAFLPKKDNFWGPAGTTGPCGPNTEMFYWLPNNIPAPKKFDPKDSKWLEIGNNVLMQYYKDEKGHYKEQTQKTIDFGGGVERIIATLNGLDDNFEADMWQPIIRQIEKLSKKSYKGNERSMRIIADHIKASVMILADGMTPGNAEQGYVLRRLIRRAIRYGKELGMSGNFTSKVAGPVFTIYDDYTHLAKNKKKVLDELEKEEKKFGEALEKGLNVTKKLFQQKTPVEKNKFLKLMQRKDKNEIFNQTFRNKRKKVDYSIKEIDLIEKEINSATITGNEAFLLYQSFGFPIEMITELAREKRLFVDIEDFENELEKHQELSRTSSVGRFKSGLADNSEATTKLHTAAHLLLAALIKVLKDPKIFQKGSNITPERLRLDFAFDRKLTEAELKDVEELVNKQIKKNISVKREEMTVEQAKKAGAQGVFEHKYGEKVSVYSVGDFSKEICAGPHVKNTSELGKFKIRKQESVAAGIRRIKAVLE